MEGTSLILSRQIANAHTIFNIVVSAVMFPFVKPIAKFVEKVSPLKPEQEKQKLTTFIDEGQLAVPSVAINEAFKELVHLGKITADMVEKVARRCFRRIWTLLTRC